MARLPNILVIVGPTGSGKTNLGVFLAQQLDGEVVNADSRQVYRGMDIGTGKPIFDLKPRTHMTSDRRSYGFLVEGVPHHLFDIVQPSQTMTVADWKRHALRAIRDILKRGKLPVVVGGTGLYVQALVENLKIPEVPPNKKLREEFAKKSSEELLELLARFDPDAAARLDPKNPRRIIRALEVSIWTGKPFSKQQLKGKPKFRALQLGIEMAREKLYERIDQNVERQFEYGWIEEVRGLLKKYPRTLSAMSGIGYREIVHYLENEHPHLPSGRTTNEDMGALMQRIKYRTHEYARRQLIWLRRNQSIHWIKTPREAECLASDFLRD